ncbi:wall-associated receptor kinase-like 6 isoform X1 [Spinacia oleracea]|uniref:Wall-associated receptor kinase-like 6 isoform X1 n=2 Tax=Spinacia oleracea TaxID=3562 RepID=A0A9R0JFD2_SPIOL|nr:wall-associated receptor kinase-like 6 isoform X1 [Spinacia oleracea]
MTSVLKSYRCASVFWVVATLIVASVVPTRTMSMSMAKAGCQQSCRNSTIIIPFPFGIGTDCYYDPWYEINCNSSSPGPERPILSSFGVEVLNITSCSSSKCDITDLRIEVATEWQKICSAQKEVVNDMDSSPYMMSTSGNHLMVKGCPAVAILMNRKGNTVAGCSSVCKGKTADSSSSCDGVGCCLISVDEQYLGVDYYQMALRNNYVDTNNNTCVEFALIERSLTLENENENEIERLARDDLVPTLWHWMPPALPQGISDTSSNHSDSDFSCKSFCGYYDEVQCVNICTCNQGFQGNPYIPNGCRDPCKEGINHSSLNCKKRSLRITSAPILALNIVLGSVTLLVLGYGLYRLVKRWRQIEQRSKFFKRNGGLLLQQQMISEGGVIESTRVFTFTARELEKATDNFNNNRILGHGGQGTVYKGMLLDGRVVAIKKPNNKVKSDHFINEVVILSQINHRNVVKLLGCCLETQVPLLVYEFVPNGTLAKHIHHNPNQDFQITWKMRLQIASEIAGALAYLHSSSTTPIYHRDIKSTNILLDNKYRAKLSDFGTSRSMMIDQTHLTTRVQGTFGYMDPEYFQSNQYTEKSDVYSFGVVLAELLTGMAPVSKDESGVWKGLANEFLFHFESNNLDQILDVQVVQEEAREEQVRVAANLAKRCMNLSGKQRPTMKEVSCAVEGIRSFNIFEQLTFKGSHNNPDLIMEMGKILNDEHYTDSTTFYSTNSV